MARPRAGGLAHAVTHVSLPWQLARGYFYLAPLAPSSPSLPQQPRGQGTGLGTGTWRAEATPVPWGGDRVPAGGPGTLRAVGPCHDGTLGRAERGTARHGHCCPMARHGHCCPAAWHMARPPLPHGMATPAPRLERSPQPPPCPQQTDPPATAPPCVSAPRHGRGRVTGRGQRGPCCVPPRGPPRPAPQCGPCSAPRCPR